MKKFLFALLMLASVTAQAQYGHWRHGGGHYVYRDGFGWVVPALIGGAIVYEATRPTVVVTPPPTIVIQQPQQPAPYGYHYEAILDANCNCYKTVLIQN